MCGKKGNVQVERLFSVQVVARFPMSDREMRAVVLAGRGGVNVDKITLLQNLKTHHHLTPLVYVAQHSQWVLEKLIQPLC